MRLITDKGMVVEGLDGAIKVVNLPNAKEPLLYQACLFKLLGTETHRIEYIRTNRLRAFDKMQTYSTVDAMRRAQALRRAFEHSI